ncbi:Myosin-3 [Cytospora mali]|uniref:Myosin-3 n=1 Tax=Cytospora mali TaxID=578113 RepID=A0A194VIQ2_CYTMA|nr:Myosin-3 [Valsa mali]
MASSSASSPDPLTTPAANTGSTPYGVPAIVEWKADDSQSRYLGCSPDHPANLFFQFDALAKTGFFKLSIAFAWRKIGTRVQRRTAPLYLCLQLSNLRRLSFDLSCPLPPDEFLGPLEGRDLACVSVELTGFPVLWAPGWPLTPQNKSHNPALDSVKQLAQLSAFNIYVQRGPTLATEDLRLLCRAVNNNEAWPDNDPRDTAELYDGRRGRVIGLDLLAPVAGPPNTTRPNSQNPPAYHDLEPPPPMAPLTGTKKRRRASSDSGPIRDEVGSESLPRKPLGDELALIRDRMELLEQRASESERARDNASRRVEDLEQRLTKVEHERDSARGRMKELEDQLKELNKGKDQVEQLNEDLQALENHIDDRVWVEVDDLRTSVRGDFDELQRELRCDVADLVQDALNDAV